MCCEEAVCGWMGGLQATNPPSGKGTAQGAPRGAWRVLKGVLCVRDSVAVQNPTRDRNQLRDQPEILVTQTSLALCVRLSPAYFHQ